MDEFRIIKTQTALGPFDYSSDDLAILFQQPAPEIITWYEVQVRGLFLWHTIKCFRSIRKAAELLHKLREPEE